MNKSNRQTQLVMMVIMLLSLILILYDYSYRLRLVAPTPQTVQFLTITANPLKLLFIKILCLVSLLIAGVTVPKKLQEYQHKDKTQPWYLVAYTLLSVTVFLVGYQHIRIVNLFFYPLSIVASIYLVFRVSVQLLNRTVKEQVSEPLTQIHYNKNAELQLKTDKGLLSIEKSEYGYYIEGAAGSGKSVLIEYIVYHLIQQGRAGVIYDYEGNSLEPGGAILSKMVQSAILDAGNKIQTKFAFLNCDDLTKTVRCNPISRRYLKRELDVIEIANTLMKNLETEWIEKTDFWASNAINVVVGCILRLWKDYPQYCTIPHVVALVLSDFELTLAFLDEDPELRPRIQPVISAYKLKAQQQTAGVISSSQLPLTKLFTPEIFYVFSPTANEEYDLDVTNKDNPQFLCLGFNPKLQAALSPVFSLVLVVCMKQMNNFGKQKALFAIDELPTIYIPNLDKFPATVRKHKVATLLSVQTYKQLDDANGSKKAEIIRDNLSNVFLGKTNSFDSAKLMSEKIGDYKKIETSLSYSENDSESVSKKAERIVPPEKIIQQPIGHFTGFVAQGKPNFFHCQFDYFEVKKFDIPSFSNVINSGDIEIDRKAMANVAQLHFKKINNEITNLLSNYEEQARLMNPKRGQP